MSTIRSERGRSTPAVWNVDASTAWHSHYVGAELVGSIRPTVSGYEARDRRQNAVGHFDSWAAAATFLERGAA
jgi:hypothetical protein